MAKYKCKKKDSQLFIKVKLSRNEKLNEGELDFFSRQHVNGLYKARKLRGKRIEFYGPVGISLRDRLKKPISKYDFFLLIELIVRFIRAMSASALAMNKVVFDLNRIYFNENTKEIRFIYLPLEIPKAEADIIGFLETLIYSVNPFQEIDKEYLSRLIYFLREMTVFNPDQLEQYIMNESSIVKDEINRNKSYISHETFNTPRDYRDYCDYSQNNTNDSIENEDTGLLNFDDEATGLLNDEATGFLDDDSTGLLVEATATVNYPKLYRVLTDEMIEINKPVFRIGKEKSYTDYFVNNNGAVSRNHADIVVRGNRYFVIDLNSKNRTFINEQAIPVRQETEICNGDKLKLANEEFIFYAT